MRMRLSGSKTRHRNWLNRRAWARGKTPLPDRIARQFTSRLPVYRNRVNPATGRPRRDDRRIGRTGDRAMAQHKTRRDAVNARAAANQQHVRDTFRARYPQYAEQAEQRADRVARDVAARRAPSRGAPQGRAPRPARSRAGR